MPVQPSIPIIISTAKARLYLSYGGVSSFNAFKTGAFTNKPPKLIFAMLNAVEGMYNLNPNEPSLRNVANYLWWLVAPQFQANTNLLTSNLAAVAVSTTEIDLSWTSVPNGVTYTLDRALDAGFTSGVANGIYTGGALAFADTGRTPATHYFYRIHVSAPGFTDSPYSFANATTQSVIVPITVSYYYGDTDFYPTLQGGLDNVPYVGSINVTHNAPFTITWPLAAANNRFQVIRIPIGENVKTMFFNTPLNQGAIPGPEYQSPLMPAGLPLYYYICSRTAISLDGTTLTETFS